MNPFKLEPIEFIQSFDSTMESQVAMEPIDPEFAYLANFNWMQMQLELIDTGAQYLEMRPMKPGWANISYDWYDSMEEEIEHIGIHALSTRLKNHEEYLKARLSMECADYTNRDNHVQGKYSIKELALILGLIEPADSGVFNDVWYEKYAGNLASNSRSDLAKLKVLHHKMSRHLDNIARTHPFTLEKMNEKIGLFNTVRSKLKSKDVNPIVFDHIDEIVDSLEAEKKLIK